MYLYVVLLLFAGIIRGQCQTTSVVAKVSMGGIKGTIQITNNTNSNVQMTVKLTGLTNDNTWTIKEVRMIYDVSDSQKCLDKQLGNRYGSAGGTIPASGTVTSALPTTVVPDINMLVGRSIVLVDSVTSARVCATLEEDGDYVTAMARFPSDVAGLVVFRQLASSSSGATSIFSNLFFVDNTATATDTTMDWMIYDGQIAADTDASISLANRCSNIGSVYNPTGASGSSRVGDLSGKFGKVDVAALAGDQRQGFVDMNLALSGSNNISNKVLALLNSTGSVISCATIREIKPKEAKSIISRDGVSAEFTFYQRSPYDQTKVDITASGLQSHAGGYHVHEWPVPQKLETSEAVCNAEYVSGHWNPFNIAIDASISGGLGTDDQYEIGDLSGKYGSFDSLNDYNETYMDWNLPLFGVNSVVGRSMVIHKSLTGAPRWVCASIYSTEKMKIARVKFLYPVIGYLILQQSQMDWFYADTQMYAEFNYDNGNTQSTSNHNMHVHIHDVDPTYENMTSRCGAALGHYNPYGVDLKGNYATQCNENNPYRCEVGDLSGKHGQVTVRSSTVAGQPWRGFFTDVDLPLSGPLSIIGSGKSVVIHGQDSGGERLSCSDVEELKERVVEANLWKKMSSSSMSGYVKMTENSPGILSGDTTVDVSLNNLASSASGFHVHLYPLSETDNSPCSAASVGGHFNPFGVNVSESPAGGLGTDDQYEVGDLSGRYGDPLRDQSSYSGRFMDTMLPLRGPLSIVGRSVVIHKSDSSGSRWVCGNIVEDTAIMQGVEYKSRAVFSEGKLRGEIVLIQYLYPDGSMSDTEITVDLKMANSSTTVSKGHNWHVHNSIVVGDMNTGCMSPGPHFNPFHVNVTDNYDECSFTNPLRCEVGDQSGKLGQYDIGSGRRFYTDVNLPLVGQYGVTGRSFVVHNADGTTPRMACADIVPVGGKLLQMTFPIIANFDKLHMRDTLANALGTQPYNLMIQDAPSSVASADCMSVMVYFIGTESNSLHSALMSMADTHSSMLSSYGQPCGAAGSLLASITTLVMVILLQRIVSKFST